MNFDHVRASSSLLAVALLLCLPADRAKADYGFTPDINGRTSCDVIAAGTVLTVDQVREVDHRKTLWVATVYVTKVEKGLGLVAGSCVEVYFIGGNNGWSMACPSPVRLRVGDERAIFARCIDFDMGESLLFLPSDDHVCPSSAI